MNLAPYLNDLIERAVDAGNEPPLDVIKNLTEMTGTAVIIRVGTQGSIRLMQDAASALLALVESGAVDGETMARSMGAEFEEAEDIEVYVSGGVVTTHVWNEDRP